MPKSRHISLSKKGEYQVLVIPHEFALSGTEVLLRQEGDRLIIEAIASTSLLDLLNTLPDIADEFPDIDEALLLMILNFSPSE
ncbi:twitching motility protein PilT [Planktothricoides sp. SR001]|uniref:antitoxin n=1 Tax=Planktothricoides sp. SR001 TaxID=1705388 RepID=UPI0006C4DDFD|nr:twitching motility protein PilT [Planktothricoides sp. SR001]KOR34890.1 twitching motility protein PilT [Planktothricoides sp. SR001]